MAESIMLDIISDLEEVHKASDLRLKEIDDQILTGIACVQKSSIPLNDLEPLRVKMWFEYSNKMLNKIDILLKDLSIHLVKVKAFRARYNDATRKYSRAKVSFETEKLGYAKHLKPITDSFYEIVKLWNDIIDEEDELRQEAWLRFLTSVYLPFGGTVTVVYWALYVGKIFDFSLTNALFWYGVLLVLLYYILAKLVVSRPKADKEEATES